VWDMATLWRNYTGFGFVFAMWMVRDEKLDVDFAGARDEGVTRMAEIVDAYKDKIPQMDLHKYLTENIVYRIDESMQRGLQLYFELASKHRLIERVKPLRYI
jgi:chorismate dehydratase